MIAQAMSVWSTVSRQQQAAQAGGAAGPSGLDDSEAAAELRAEAAEDAQAGTAEAIDALAGAAVPGEGAVPEAAGGAVSRLLADVARGVPPLPSTAALLAAARDVPATSQDAAAATGGFVPRPF